MKLYYEGSEGSIINLMGDGVYAQNPETLTGSKWQYTATSEVNGLGRIKRFYKKMEERPLDLSIMTDSEEEFNELTYRMHRIFERDIRRVQPGKIWWNDWYKEVFVVETSNDEFEENFQSIERSLKLLSTKPYWTKETKFQYLDRSEGGGTLDYDDSRLDYDDFDYDLEELIEVIQNDCIGGAKFELKFYGPCQNPAVTVGNHIYELYTELESGEYAVIDSRHKTIRKYGAYGEEENIFADRNKESYIFQEIPEGTISVSRDKLLKVDITLYDERGEPEWI